MNIGGGKTCCLLRQQRAPLQLSARLQSDVVLSSLIEGGRAGGGAGGGGGVGGDRGWKGGGVMSGFAGKCSVSQEKDKEGGKGRAPMETWTREERAKRGKRES